MKSFAIVILKRVFFENEMYKLSLIWQCLKEEIQQTFKEFGKIFSVIKLQEASFVKPSAACLDCCSVKTHRPATTS